MVVNYEERRRLLRKHHVTPDGDHKGIAVTRNSISKSYYWIGITKDVHNIVCVTMTYNILCYMIYLTNNHIMVNARKVIRLGKNST